MSLAIEPEKLYAWRQAAIADSIAANISPAEVDWFILAVAQVDKLSLRLGLTTPSVELNYPWSKILQLWQQRIQHQVPLQYLIGKTTWRHLELQVTPAVLIPRPETEYLIDLAIRQAELQPDLAQGDWVDLGTGSGAIAIGLAAAFPKITVHAVDISRAALEIAQQNAINLGFGDRLQFYQGCWWQPLRSLRGKVTGVISNPPYIPSSEIPQLQPEVARHEPLNALDGGVDGLDCLRTLIATTSDYLRSGGIWLGEMMAGQGKIVAELLSKQGSYQQIEILRDFAGFDRYSLAYRSF